MAISYPNGGLCGSPHAFQEHAVVICARKNQQMHQLFIQFINYVRYLLHVLALHFHHQGVFLEPSERRSIEHLSEGTRNAP
jgi:hypothetical protein